MKKLISIAALLLVCCSVFASQTYVCPQRILCADGQCYLPKEFENPFVNNKVINMELVFYKAANLPFPLCQYVAVGKYFNQEFYLQTSLNATPDTSSVNDWAISKGGAAICGSKNPIDCPWSVN